VFDLSAGFEGLKAFCRIVTAQLRVHRFRLDLRRVLFRSLEVATLATALYAVGFPIAYGMARAPRAAAGPCSWRRCCVLDAFLIRIYAWINILQPRWPAQSGAARAWHRRRTAGWLATDTAVYIGLVIPICRFMVLPIYATLEKLDETLLEAAADLAARPGSVLAGERCGLAQGSDRRVRSCASSRWSASL